MTTAKTHEVLASERRTRAIAKLAALAAEQGIKPVTDTKVLEGNFWPEDETVDEFLEARRQWKTEGLDRSDRSLLRCAAGDTQREGLPVRGRSEDRHGGPLIVRSLACPEE